MYSTVLIQYVDVNTPRLPRGTRTCLQWKTMTPFPMDSLSNWLTGLMIATLLILITIKYLDSRRWNLPPGPFAWPIIGNATVLMATPDDNAGAKRVWDFTKKYSSDIVSMRVGRRPAVVLHKIRDVREAYSKEAFHYRPKVLGISSKGIFGNNGQRWREQRRFALHTLRDFGLGKNRMEAVIQSELDYSINEISRHESGPFDTTDLVSNATANVISYLVFGHRFEYTDETFLEMTQMVSQLFLYAREVSIQQYIPFSKYLPLNGKSKLDQALDRLFNGIYKPEVDQHLRDYDPNKIEDYISAFIKEMKEHEGTTEQHWFTEEQLLYNIGDLFQTGTDTTAGSIRWTLLCMVKYPEVQKKVRAEIRDNIGFERPPSMADKLHLPYTEATILEVQRKYGVVAPLLLVHQTTEATQLKGYNLPPDTLVGANLYAIHNDPEHWGDPEVFRPERFLGDDGKVKRDDHFSVFSVGKRQCLGESLAKMELFIFFVGLMQKFEVRLPEGASEPVMRPKLNHSTQSPIPYSVRFVSSV
ncbi:unnamed protein product [Owenia fusiformis]|uniref:Cytochrome P450 n=1 Tax=Owenia fusiformis TaxID=6347 RepID=A0A8S4Q9I0_OWEFU|nr:unnamed protein product [Owenia fusiformis]